jgi:hypothetical protein
MQKPILEHAKGERNEVVLLADPIGRTCSGNSGNTHDGNDYPKGLVYRCFICCFVPINFGIRWK